jgi:hypothetical protein
MRRDSLDEEPVCDALSAGAALLTLAMVLPACVHAHPSNPSMPGRQKANVALSAFAAFCFQAVLLLSPQEPPAAFPRLNGFSLSHLYFISICSHNVRVDVLFLPSE